MPNAHAGPAHPIIHVGRSCPIAHPICHLKSHTGPVHPICPAYLLSYAGHIVHLFPEDLADWNALRSC